MATDHQPDVDGSEFVTLILRRIHDAGDRETAILFATGTACAALGIVARERGAAFAWTLAATAIAAGAPPVH